MAGPRAKKAATPKEKAGSKKKATDEAVTRDSDIEKVRVEKEVPMPMSSEEFTRDAMALAGVQGKISELDTKFAEVATKHRKDTRELRKESVRLTSAINNRRVMKSITCIQIRDYALNQVRYVDPKDETKEVLPSEPMPPAMKQRQLFDEAPAGERVDVEEDDEE